MDHANFSMRLKLEELPPEIVVEKFIGQLISTCGYDAAIYDLFCAVHHLAQASVASPQDIVAQRLLNLWANGVRAAILSHGDTITFKDRISNFDQSFACEMGISLD